MLMVMFSYIIYIYIYLMGYYLDPMTGPLPRHRSRNRPGPGHHPKGWEPSTSPGAGGNS